MPEFLLAAGDSATVVESVGPEVYGKIFGGGVGLFVVGVGGAAITALLIDSTDAYERLAEDFGAEGMKGLEEEFGADAARAVVEGVKSDTADRKIDVTAPAPKEEPLFELPSLPSLPNPFGGGDEAAPAAAPMMMTTTTTTARLRARRARRARDQCGTLWGRNYPHVSPSCTRPSAARRRTPRKEPSGP